MATSVFGNSGSIDEIMARYYSGGAFPTGVNLPTGLYPRTGLTDYGTNAASGAIGTLQPAPGNYMKALLGMGGAGDAIEKSRQAMISRGQTELKPWLDQTLGTTINRLAGRGVLSSSAAQGTLGDVGKAFTERMATTEQEANKWAADAELTNLKDQVSGWSNAMGMLNSLLGTSKEQSDQWTPYRDVLALFQAMA